MRYPAPALKSAWSAQAALAVTGPWQERTGLVAYVLVRRDPPSAASRRRPDEQAFVVSVQIDPSYGRFVAVRDPELRVDGMPEGLRARMSALLSSSVHRGLLRPREALLLVPNELVHVGAPTGPQKIGSRLQLLHDLAALVG